MGDLMRPTATIAAIAILACAAWAQEPATQPQSQPQMSQPYRLDFAGIQLSFPADFLLLASQQPTDVIQAQRLENGQPVFFVSLSALLGGKDLKLADFVNGVGPNPEDLSKTRVLTMRNLKIIKSEPIKVSGAEGELRLMSYTMRTIETLAVRVYFLRTEESASVKMGYALTVEVPKPRSKELLPTLAAIITTIKLFEPAHPELEKMAFSENLISSQRNGYAFRPPMWWKIQQEGSSLTTFQTDYLMNGVRLPMATLVTLPSNDTPAEVAKKGLDFVVDSLRRQKRELKSVREHETKMADLDAFEMIAREEPQVGDKSGRYIFAAQRSIVTNGKSFSLTLVAQTEKVETITAAMDSLAANFSLVKESATQPGSATAPAAAPATGPASRPVPETLPAVSATVAEPETDSATDPSADTLTHSVTLESLMRPTVEPMRQLPTSPGKD